MSLLFDLRVLIWNLLTQLASPRRQCRMCGTDTAARTKWCSSTCRGEYLDFWSPGH